MTKTRMIVFLLVLLIAAGFMLSLAKNNPGQADSASVFAKGIISLDVQTADGKVHVLLGSETDGKQSIWYLSSTDLGQSWTTPVNVMANVDKPANLKRGNDARLAVQGDKLVAVWMQKTDKGPYHAGPVMAVRSDDGGHQWQQTAMPADWLGPHGFFAIDASPDAFDLVWLDSREQSVKGAQGLRYTRSMDNGKTWQANRTLDAVTCACCWNTARFSDDGELFVLYRDKLPSDMALGSLDQSGQWQRLSTVGEFGWEFEGCPHAGGGLAIEPEKQVIHATVATGKDGQAGVYYLRSADNGQSWSQPHVLGSETAIHSDIAVADDGSVVAVWDQLGENGMQVFYSRATEAGSDWQKGIKLSETHMSADHPRVVAVQDRFLVFWTSQDAQGLTQLKMQSLAAGG